MGGPDDGVTCLLDLGQLFGGFLRVHGRQQPGRSDPVSLTVADAAGAEVLARSATPAADGSFEVGQGLGTAREGRLTVTAGEGLRLEAGYACAEPLGISHLIRCVDGVLELKLDLYGLRGHALGDLCARAAIEGPYGTEVVRGELAEITGPLPSLSFPLDRFTDGTWRATVALAPRADGTEIVRRTHDVRIARTLAGLGTTIGLTDAAPPPWSPVEVERGDGLSLGVWGRRYVFGASLLLSASRCWGETCWALRRTTRSSWPTAGPRRSPPVRSAWKAAPTAG